MCDTARICPPTPPHPLSATCSNTLKNLRDPLSVSRKAVGCTFHWWVYMCQACKKSLSPVWLRTQLPALSSFSFFLFFLNLFIFMRSFSRWQRNYCQMPWHSQLHKHHKHTYTFVVIKCPAIEFLYNVNAVEDVIVFGIATSCSDIRYLATLPLWFVPWIRMVGHE